MNTHRESWLAWILSALGGLAIIAVFWFYVVFHRFLGLSLHQLGPAFIVLAVILVCFSIAAKPSREKFINCNRLAPMWFAVWSFLSCLSLWFVYYAWKFGYFNRSFALVCYVVSIVAVPLLGLLTYPIMRSVLRNFGPRGVCGTVNQGNEKTITNVHAED
jgi:hypothetical protein